MDLLNISKNRYTTKAYDASKKIPQEQFERLLEILRLAPSSINIQPWHFFIIDNHAAKQRIAKSLVGKYAYNAPKVLDSSHTILFCTKADITEDHLENLLNQDDKSGRFKDAAAKQGQKDGRTGYVDYYRNEKGDIQRWAENQTFIALGQMLLAAGIEGRAEGQSAGDAFVGGRRRHRTSRAAYLELWRPAGPLRAEARQL